MTSERSDLFELGQSLLQWIKTFETPEPVRSYDDLQTGHLIWHVLRDVDPNYFRGDLPETDLTARDNWIARWQNLKHVDRAVTTYIREECKQLQTLSHKMTPDLKAIAAEASPGETIKLLKAVFVAALFSEMSNERMVGIIGELGPRAGNLFMSMINDMQELDQRLAEYGVEAEEIADPTEPSSDPVVARDPELEKEENLIQAYAENRSLQERIDTLNKEVATLYTTKEDLQHELDTVQDRLANQNKASTSEAIEVLRIQNEKDREYIADLENQLSTTQDQLQRDQRELEQLKADAVSKYDLRDQLQLIQAERDELSRRDKANENLKKKIQTLKEDARDAEFLRNDFREATEKIKELEKIREACARLQKSNAEQFETISNGEREIFAQKTARKHLEHELTTISQRYEQILEFKNRNEERIKELQDQVLDLEARSGGTGLADELDDAATTTTGDPEPTQSHKLQASVASFGSPELEVLRTQLETLRKRNDELEEQYLTLFQENLGLKSVLDNSTDEKNEDTSYYLRQKHLLDSTTDELKEIKAKLVESLTEVAQLKEGASNDAEGAATEAAEAQQTLIGKLQAELEQERSLLKHALNRKDALATESESEHLLHSIQLARTQLLDLTTGPPTELDQRIDQKADELGHQIHSYAMNSWLDRETPAFFSPPPPAELRAAAGDAEGVPVAWHEAQVGLVVVLVDERARDGGLHHADVAVKLATRDAEVETLRTELVAARNSTPADGDPVTRQELEYLRRENTLLTTAWYDLASRMQSNTLMLQRRSEAPKSWLGRQRVSVSGASTRR
ncbi:hypothetical protein P152DRAFT_475863 [Eremomyces bilateralis CBS 781.70]|uniref:HOOK N-terminal domain-containing protein n=1 Tax=Eremomyces bilateralis CBS 781.70 TaxID=1392243 RepID=A0A6G1FWT8_9PEZI|nr:uncharacterized protein P152DRAFT_475863 [Eremomyces bilateralis CBS 781.70]KAF1810307.1 hypothetical protein P152DRAFT_475863 [Eremomyces bilateralis CBS 781.70]